MLICYYTFFVSCFHISKSVFKLPQSIVYLILKDIVQDVDIIRAYAYEAFVYAKV